ncbi:MAG TPA: AarF/UbiB family protein [Streptosporangiaceae bacterium]|nr:AarF/UbiB family protein [Streptosporangiaceae bacterium]
MTIPTLLTFILGATVDVTLLAYGARRLLAERRFSLSRTIVAGLAGQALTSSIFFALASGWHIGARGPSLAYGVVLGFAALSWACGLLLAMAILVTWQAFIPAGTVPPPATWPRSLRSRAARSRRYWQIVRIFTRCGVGPLIRGPWSATMARSLTEALDRSGVVFVKFGQGLSTRRDLLPPEFTTELGRLQDQVSPLPWDQIEPVLAAELGGTAMFAVIDREPLASASIAQVHAATLRTGERVVVKILRPGVTHLVERDLDIIARLARRTEARAAWARAIGVATLAEGFAVGLREELDFRIEAANLAAASAASAAEGVVIPRVHHDLSTRQVLVMERLDGQALSKAAPADGDRERLARELLDCVLRQIVIDGIFHADPHPGNIMLLDDGRLGLIDFGATGRLDSGLRAALQRLLLALERRDPVALTDALLEVTARPDDLDEQALERSVGALLVRHLAAGRPPDITLFTELLRLVTRHELAVPPEFAATFRALSILEGGLTLLAPGFDIVAEAERFGQSQLTKRLSPDSLKEAAAEEVVALLPMLRRLPRRVDRIAAAVEGGRLSVNVRLLADERDRKVITGWVQLGVLTILAATAGFMAVALLALKGGPAMTSAIGLYQFLGYCLLVICALLALRVLAAVFRTGPP